MSGGQEPIIQEGEDLSPQARKRGFRLIILCSIFAMMGSQTFVGNIMTLIAWHLGGRERFIGLIGFVCLAASVVQMLIVPLAQQTSKKWFAIVMLSAAYAATIPVFFAKSISDNVGIYAGLTLLACCIGGRQMCMNAASPSWTGLLRELTTPDRRGTLLGTMRTWWQSMMVVTLILAGLYLGKDPSSRKLQYVIAVGFLAQVLRILVMLPLPPPPKRRPAQRMSWWRMISTPIRDKTYRPFLLYVVFYGMGLGIYTRFRMVYLLRLGFGEDLALIASSLAGLGAVVTLIFWGRLADRFGNRGVFGLTLAGLLTCTVLWLFVNFLRYDATYRLDLVLAMLLFGAAGAFDAGNTLVRTRYMFAALRAEFDIAYFASTALCTSLAGAVGALLGGQILSLGHSLGLRPRYGVITNYHVVFVLGAGLLLLAFRFRRRFHRQGEARTRDVVAAVARRARAVFQPVPHQDQQ